LRAELIQKAEAKLKRARSWWRSNMGNEAAAQRWISYLQRSAVRSQPVSKRTGLEKPIAEAIG
jgi:hypothetical protein